MQAKGRDTSAGGPSRVAPSSSKGKQTPTKYANKSKKKRMQVHVAGRVSLAVSRFLGSLASELDNVLKRKVKILSFLGKGIIDISTEENDIQTLPDNLFKDCKEASGCLNGRWTSLYLPAAKQLHHYISGLLLTSSMLDFRAAHRTCVKFAAFNLQLGVIIDKGHVPLPTGELITEGLDGLEERCVAYVELGLTFAMWRSVFKVTDTLPSTEAININVNDCAKFVNICQSVGMVPILSCHFDIHLHPDDVIRSKEGPKDVLVQMMKALQDHHVLLEGMILRFNAIRTRCKPDVRIGVAGTTAALPSIMSNQPDWKHIQDGAHHLPLWNPRTKDMLNCVVATSLVIKSSVVPAIGGLMMAEGDNLEVSTQVLSGLNMGGIDLGRQWVFSVSYCFSKVIQEGVLARWTHRPKLTYTPYAASCNLHWACELLVKRAKEASRSTVGYREERDRSVFLTNVTQL